MAKFAGLAAAPLLYSPSAVAWGGLGHEAICELAFLELDDTARQRVIALIQQDDEFTTFRALCNWADRPRQRAPEHRRDLEMAVDDWVIDWFGTRPPANKGTRQRRW